MPNVAKVSTVDPWEAACFLLNHRVEHRLCTPSFPIAHWAINSKGNSSLVINTNTYIQKYLQGRINDGYIQQLQQNNISTVKQKKN
jgi:hypothetical protein